MLQNGVVAEEVLVWSLDTEGSLCPHETDSLPHIQSAQVLQLGQTNVQGTECTWKGRDKVRFKGGHMNT